MENQSPYESLVLQGTMERNIGELDLALGSFHEALKHPPPSGSWRANAMLAHIYLDKGTKATALQHATKALADAPAEVKPALQELQMEILGLRQLQPAW